MGTNVGTKSKTMLLYFPFMGVSLLQNCTWILMKIYE